MHASRHAITRIRQTRSVPRGRGPMRLRMVFCVGVGLAILMAADLAPAALIAHDSFTGYTSGTLNGQGQGVGWTGPWSTSSPGTFSAVPANDLTYAGLTGSTGLAQVGALRGAGISRAFPPVGTGTLYFGALIQYTNTVSGIRLVSLSGPGSGNSGFVSLGQYGANPWSAFTTLQYLDARPASGDVGSQVGQSSGVSITTQTTHLVGKIQFDTSGSSDSMWFWVNPPDATAVQDTTGFQASLINPYNIGSMGSFYVYVDHPSAGFYFDEVRVATSAADLFGAVPEPTALVLLTVATLLAWRCRQSHVR